MSTRTTIAFVGLFCLEIACGGDDVPPPPEEKAFFPATWAADLTEVRGCRNSIDHAPNHIRVVVDDLALPAYQGRDRPFPPGAVVLKAEYEDPDCTEVAGFTVMRKEPAGTRPGSGDWSFQRTDASRRVLGSNEPRCISCHEACQPPDGYDWTCTEP